MHERSKPHVVIVGAGFAGLHAARRLGKAAKGDVRVTIVDRHNYHTFQPLLYQVATAGLEAQSIGHNIRNAVRRLGVGYRFGAAVGADLDARKLFLEDGSTVDYDALVLAAGTATADYGIDGVADHAFPLKSLPEATRLRNHLLRQFERLEADPHDAQVPGETTFVIAGGGPTGVELAGAIAELIERVVALDHPHVDPSRARIVLVEMLDTLLPAYSEPSRRYVREALEERGVEVRLDTAIEAVHADRAVLSDGEEIPTKTVVWTAGVQANPLAGVLGLEQAKGGRIVVSGDLRVPGRSDIFVAGDLAAAVDEEGEPLPQLAPVAIQQGKHVADQILRLRGGVPTQRFRYRDKGTMATIGRRDAVAELPLRLRLHGTAAWLSWLVLHLAQLVGGRNRVSVLIDWIYNYFTYDRAARLILDQDEPDEHAHLSAGKERRSELEESGSRR